MSIAYSHKNKNTMDGEHKATLVVETPPKEHLLLLFKTFSTALPIKLGYTICSLKDKYTKKIGRENATKRMNFQVCSLKSIEIRGCKQIFHFYVRLPHLIRKNKKKHLDIIVSFGLSISEEKEGALLTYADIYETGKLVSDTAQ